MPFSGVFDHARAEVDAHTFGRTHGGQEVSGSTANFEDGSTFGDDEAIGFFNFAMVVAVALAETVPSVGQVVVVGDAFRPIGREAVRRRNEGACCCALGGGSGVHKEVSLDGSWRKAVKNW